MNAKLVRSESLAEGVWFHIYVDGALKEAKRGYMEAKEIFEKIKNGSYYERKETVLDEIER